MTIPLYVFLWITIPEVTLFYFWIRYLMWVTIDKPKPKKKSNEIILRKSNYPHDSGEPVTSIDT